jgi:non-ribosomal peptide synthetase-like protein
VTPANQPGPALDPERDPDLLHHFFARTARRLPDQIAIDVPPGPGRPRRRTLTYAELDRRSDVFAHVLAPLVTRDSIVAIAIERSDPDLFAAQLGALKAGAAYVCLEATLPPERLRLIVDDAAPVALLIATPSNIPLDSLALRAPVLDVANLSGEHDQTPLRTAAQDASPESLAYLIYTSGTTGRPKGVMIEHGSIANLVGSDLSAFGLEVDDRVLQGSSPAYDSSVEETWLALAAGGTVVVGCRDTVRLGPDLVDWLRAERVTVLCPPPTLLRAMSCGDPEAALPDLRLIYAGGEAMPADVAVRWGRGRTLVNGYGPTECTVTVVRGELTPEAPTIIGRAVRGHTAHVLDAELEPVKDGAPGELCVTGPGLARGYRNDPALTARRFPISPRFGRMYRTGDLVRREPSGDLVFLGRVDQQVKLRGYRIELEEIEAHLRGFDGVAAAACKLCDPEGAPFLAGYLVPREGAAPPDLDGVRASLIESLPEYMVPVHYAVLGELPTTTGGKLDRRALPTPKAKAGSGDRPITPPRNALERAILEAVGEVLHHRSLGRDDDFFDLGGNSLAAARLVSRLRARPSTSGLAVRDVYEARTPARLAARARARSEAPGVAAPAALPSQAKESAARPVLVTIAQAAWLALGLCLGSGLVYLIVFLIFPWLLFLFSPVGLLCAAPVLATALALLYAPLSIAVLVLVKRLVIGRYAAGRTEAWTGPYLRQWMVERTAGIVPWSLLLGTPLIASVLRALGARVGKRVHIHRGVSLGRGGWDLLEIGDDVTIGQDAALGLVELEDGHLIAGPVTLGNRVTLEVRASVSGGATLEADAILGALAWLPPGSRVPCGERWTGVPARHQGPALAPPLPEAGSTVQPAVHGAWLLGAQLGLGALRTVPLLLALIAVVLGFELTADSILGWLFVPYAAPAITALVVAAIAALGPFSLTAEALLVRALGNVQAGAIHRYSPAYLRVWLKPGLVEATGRWLSGTLLWPVWLRAAGMRVGEGCEISTITDVLPERIAIGAESFLADGIYLGGPRIHRGVCVVGETRLDSNTFLGNHVVVPTGAQLPPDFLLGVATVADADTMRRGTSWFGHPAFELPRREVVQLDRRLTHEPGPWRYLRRLAWELLRFALAIPAMLVLLAWLHIVAAAESSGVGIGLLIGAVVPLTTLAAGSVLVAGSIALKWILLGRVRPGQHALWSSWCSRWDFFYVAWGYLARGWVRPLEGTLLLGWVLRALGVTLGRRVVLGAGFAQVVDPDMLHIEDGATIDGLFQAHSFEDRVLKTDHVVVEQGATVGRNAVLLYGARIGAGARACPHTVVMKHEHLLPGQTYAGAPSDNFDA